MKLICALSAYLALSQGLVSASPIEDGSSVSRRQSDRGSYQYAGLGSRKQQILNVGGNTLDLAIAMLETENMGTNYPYGDNKSGDSANFGIFKQNWYMLRNAVPDFRGQTSSQWNNGAVLNNDLARDVNARHTSQNYYGYNTWFGGHRNGQTGINNPNTADIARYRSAIEWIQQQIESNQAYLRDDTRFWVNVPAI